MALFHLARGIVQQAFQHFQHSPGAGDRLGKARLGTDLCHGLARGDGAVHLTEDRAQAIHHLLAKPRRQPRHGPARQIAQRGKPGAAQTRQRILRQLQRRHGQGMDIRLAGLCSI